MAHALRAFARTPGWSALATISLALGISINAVLFDVSDAVLARSLPVRAPQELVRVFATTRGAGYPWLRAEPTDPSGRRWRGITVVAQLAMAVTLSTAAALLARSLATGSTASPGFDPAPIVVATAEPSLVGYTIDDAPAFFERVRAAIAEYPDVSSAAAARFLPLASQSDQLSIAVTTLDGERAGDPRTYYNIVSPDYFETMGIPLLRGRDFRTSDRPGADPVAIVNRAFAERYWPGADAVGRVVAIGTDARATVVGVVATILYRAGTESPRPYVYLPLAQRPVTLATLHAASRRGTCVRAGPGGQRRRSTLQPHANDIPAATNRHRRGHGRGGRCRRAGTLWTDWRGQLRDGLTLAGIRDPTRPRRD